MIKELKQMFKNIEPDEEWQDFLPSPNDEWITHHSHGKWGICQQKNGVVDESFIYYDEDCDCLKKTVVYVGEV